MAGRSCRRDAPLERRDERGETAGRENESNGEAMERKG